MIYLKNGITGMSYPMKKVNEVEYREMLPKKGPFTFSKVIRGLGAKQAGLIGIPFTESYDVDAKVKVSVEGSHVFTLINPHDRIWSLDSPIIFHAYDDQKPIGAFVSNETKIAIEWRPRRDIGIEVPCGIRMGIYEMEEELK